MHVPRLLPLPPSLLSPRPTHPTLYARSNSLPQVSMPTWKSACRLAYNSDGNSSCASGDTILNYLYTNASAHQAQCEAGFCMAPASVMFMCGMAPNPMMPDPPQWGEGFCRSTIFDWYVLLAPTATHSNALHSL